MTFGTSIRHTTLDTSLTWTSYAGLIDAQLVLWSTVDTLLIGGYVLTIVTCQVCLQDVAGSGIN